MEEETSVSFLSSDSELDCSFTSLCSTTSTQRTLASSAPSSARSSTTLAGSLSPANLSRKPHRSSDPQWSAVSTAARLSPDGALHLHSFKLVRHLGTGNVGRVYLCRLKGAAPGDPSACFALKVVDRDSLPEKKLAHVDTEAELLSSFDHPFLPVLYARLDASHYTCLLIDYCPGGDLHSLLRREGLLPLSAVRFYAAEVLVALEYLHSVGVVYRDLKPENVLLRADGHIMLSDFDLSFRAHVDPKVRRLGAGPIRTSCCFRPSPGHEGGDGTAELVAEPTTAFSTACVGTHEYLAPEVIAGCGHGSAVDWWAFGIFLYEMLYGVTPFKGGSKEHTLRNIASMPLRFPKAASVAGEGEARDLIARLLEKDPRTRLGYAGGAPDIKRHPFFEGIKWPLILSCPPPCDDHVSGIRGEKSRGRLLGPRALCKNRFVFGLNCNKGRK